MRFLLAAVAATAIILPTMAHDSWISRGKYRNGAGEWCCGEGDCVVVPGETIKTTPRGYAIPGWRPYWKVAPDSSLVPNDAPVTPEIIPYSEAQPSPDGQFWRCKRPDGSRRCFFAPIPAM